VVLTLLKWGLVHNGMVLWAPWDHVPAHWIAWEVRTLRESALSAADSCFSMVFRKAILQELFNLKEYSLEHFLQATSFGSNQTISWITCGTSCKASSTWIRFKITVPHNPLINHWFPPFKATKTGASPIFNLTWFVSEILFSYAPESSNVACGTFFPIYRWFSQNKIQL
jgi:hypothetical protein